MLRSHQLCNCALTMISKNDALLLQTDLADNDRDTRPLPFQGPKGAAKTWFHLISGWMHYRNFLQMEKWFQDASKWDELFAFEKVPKRGIFLLGCSRKGQFICSQALQTYHDTGNKIFMSYPIFAGMNRQSCARVHFEGTHFSAAPQHKFCGQCAAWIPELIILLCM